MRRYARAPSGITRNEAQVLGLLKAANCPLTAYQILGRIPPGDGSTAPPTVYRALKGLEAAGLVRRIATLKAWTIDADGAPAVIAICDDCGSVQSVTAPELFERLSESLAAEGFSEARRIIEVHGRCGECTRLDG